MLARLRARSGRLMVLALAIAFGLSLAAALVTYLHGPPLALAIVLIACVAFWVTAVVLLGVYVYLPPPERQSRGWAQYRTMIAAFAFATVVSNLFSTGYMAATGSLSSLSTGQVAITPNVLVIAVISLQACLAAFLVIRLVRTGILPWSEMGFTWHRLSRQIGIGLLLGFGMILLLALASLALRALGVEQTQAELFGGLKDAPLSSFIAFFLVSAVLAPFVEEAYFRGYVFHACLQSKGRWQAYAMSAGLFALAHVNLPALLPFIAFGLVMSYVVERTRNIGPCVVAHAVNNGLVALALYAAGTQI